MIERSVGVILLAGPSGSGKSYIARRTGLPVLCLDDFYKDADDPTVPQTGGQVNWESPQAWDVEEALQTITRLVRDGKADVPVYAIGEDRRVATRTFDLAGSPLFVAEGIFAAEIARECRRLGLLVSAYAIRRPRWVTFARRLLRDLAERRKAPGLLLRRGVMLLRAEPRVLARHAALGCRPMGGRAVLRRVAAHVAAATAPEPVAAPRSATAPGPVAAPRSATASGPVAVPGPATAPDPAGDGARLSSGASRNPA